jgi:hypothetical protein
MMAAISDPSATVAGQTGLFIRPLFSHKKTSPRAGFA